VKNPEKVVGVLFGVLAVVGLLRGDWLNFALLGLASASMLLRGRLKLPPAAELALALVLLLLLALSLARWFARASG
jgi:hypothetical protein